MKNIFLDLFHWDCFNAWALKFPESTQKSDYSCPDCKVCIQNFSFLGEAPYRAHLVCIYLNTT